MFAVAAPLEVSTAAGTPRPGPARPTQAPLPTTTVPYVPEAILQQPAGESQRQNPCMSNV